MLSRSGCTTSATWARPMRTPVRPAAPSSPAYSVIAGRRRSASTGMIRPPASARDTARLMAIVDYPSVGMEDVTTIDLGRWAKSMNCRSVRSRRTSSDDALSGSSRTITGVLRQLVGIADDTEHRAVGDRANICLAPHLGVEDVSH